MKLIEKLMKIDNECVDNNTHFYDLKTLYESKDLSAQEKTELKKLLDGTSDPDMIVAFLQTRETNESLDEAKESDNDIFENIYDKGLSRDRENILEFPNGEYLYIDVVDDKIIAGSATNTGIIPEYELEYDDDISLDANIEKLYFYILDIDPDRGDFENLHLNEDNNANDDNNLYTDAYIDYTLENTQNSMKTKIQDWYEETYPSDDIYRYYDDEFNDYTFMDLYDQLVDKEEIYNVIIPGDSLVRERVFDELASRLGTSYNTVYKMWLEENKKTNETNKKLNEAEEKEEETADVPSEPIDDELNKKLVDNYNNIYIWLDEDNTNGEPIEDGETFFDHFKKDNGNVGIAYTTLGDNEDYELQVNYNLNNNCYEFFIDNELKKSISTDINIFADDLALGFDSLFDWAYSVGNDLLEYDDEGNVIGVISGVIKESKESERLKKEKPIDESLQESQKLDENNENIIDKLAIDVDDFLYNKDYWKFEPEDTEEDKKKRIEQNKRLLNNSKLGTTELVSKIRDTLDTLDDDLDRDIIKQGEKLINRLISLKDSLNEEQVVIGYDLPIYTIKDKNGNSLGEFEFSYYDALEAAKKNKKVDSIERKVVDTETNEVFNVEIVWTREDGELDSTKLRRDRKNESLKESDEKIKRYSDVTPKEDRKYWYWTKHGVGPGSIPNGVNVLKTKEGKNKKGTWGEFVCLDAVLNTSELDKYDLIELAPLDESKDIAIYTNLDIDNMVDELRQHFKGVTNKQYIRDCLLTHLKNRFITKDEYDMLMNEYIGEEEYEESLKESKRGGWDISKKEPLKEENVNDFVTIFKIGSIEDGNKNWEKTVDFINENYGKYFSLYDGHEDIITTILDLEEDTVLPFSRSGYDFVNAHKKHGFLNLDNNEFFEINKLFLNPENKYEYIKGLLECVSNPDIITTNASDNMIEEIEEILPFKDDEEHYHWIDVATEYKDWHEFEDLTLHIAKRLLNEDLTDNINESKKWTPQYTVYMNGSYMNTFYDYTEATELRDRLHRQFPNKEVYIDDESQFIYSDSELEDDDENLTEAKSSNAVDKLAEDIYNFYNDYFYYDLNDAVDDITDKDKKIKDIKSDLNDLYDIELTIDDFNHIISEYDNSQEDVDKELYDKAKQIKKQLESIKSEYTSDDIIKDVDEWLIKEEGIYQGMDDYTTNNNKPTKRDIVNVLKEITDTNGWDNYSIEKATFYLDILKTN